MLTPEQLKGKIRKIAHEKNLSCIASVMRLQTAVSTDGKVKYCEFVVTAETAEELMEDMIRLKEVTGNIVSDNTIAGLRNIFEDIEDLKYNS